MSSLKTPFRHTNPVYPHYFADPFVWRHGDVYYAVGTGETEAKGQTEERIFPLLESRDFRSWRSVADALIRPDPELGTHFWAPEVAFENGRFWLYYSVGFEDKRHQLRVATSMQPTGPYKDVGVNLLSKDHCPFAIDPHPFRDNDGSWYLFYARDFLDCDEIVRAGTALMVAQMQTMTELISPGNPVLRACWDWQRFQQGRSMYNSIYDWHTLEGPAVIYHEGLYYCFYSGGRWENETYGVDYTTASKVMGPYTDSGVHAGPRVLRTVPGEVVGPGHNSLIKGPEGKDYIVYHAWDPGMQARRMFIDELLWTSEGPRCAGPICT